MSERASRFLARVDRHLPTLDEDLRAEFLRLQRDHWENLYLEWQAKIDSIGWDAYPNIEATDFILTIAGLDQRLALNPAGWSEEGAA